MRRKLAVAVSALAFTAGAAVVISGMPELVDTSGGLGFAVAAPAAAAWWLGHASGRRAARAAVRRLTAFERVGEEVVWECDARGRLTYASAQSLELLGYRPEEARSLLLAEVVHPDEWPAVAALLERGEGWWRRRFRCVGKDGTDVWLRSSAVAQHGPDGRLLGFSGAWHLLDDGADDIPGALSTSAEVRRLLRGDGLRTAFQPIVSLATGQVLGIEALSRFPGDSGRSPEDWFTGAAKVGLAVDLELHALERALHAADALPEHLYLSVNLSPATLLESGLHAVLTAAPLAPSRILVEITEHAPVEDYRRLARALRPLRAAGIRLAVDDAGAGYASFQHILSLAPDVIKLDRALVSGIDTDPARRALAGAVVGFAHDQRATVVAEGIEQPAELTAAVELGVDAGQGYLLGRPGPLPAQHPQHRVPARAPGAGA